MRIATMAAAVVVAAAVVMTSLATASASPTKTARLGAAQTHADPIYDDNDNLEGVGVTSYTVSNLQPSNDVLDAPLAGRLWEAALTVKVVQGPGVVVPGVPFFNARSAGGDNYRELWKMAAPHGFVVTPLPVGGQATGKIYFDVTGLPPTEVAFNDVLQDLLVWN